MCKDCPECGSAELLRRDCISVTGGYGSNLLPGSGKWFAGPKFSAVVCKGCRLVRYYAESETLAGISTERGWQRLR